MSPVRTPLLAIALTLVTALAGATSAVASSVTPAPDTVWGCFPGRSPDPCDGSQATTYLRNTTLQPRKIDRVETPVADPDAPVDCFYVYPTVTSAIRGNAPKHLTSEVQSILHYQAARFSQVCKVYAPIYRQSTLLGLSTQIALHGQIGDPYPARPAPTLDLAYRDVLGAWNDYLANENHGRGVVLIGHSQGSVLLTRLLREEIDPRPEVRSRLVSAILPGGNATVLKGQRTGGDFEHVPTCATGDEAGCVIAFSTFLSRPKQSALFGLTRSVLRTASGLSTKPGTEVICTSPTELAGDGDRLRSITRSEPMPGAVGFALSAMFFGLPPRASTPWVVPGERFKGSCQRSATQNGEAHVFRIARANLATVVPYESPWPDWGLHLADLNLPLGNLIRIVAEQSATYLKTGITALVSVGLATGR